MINIYKLHQTHTLKKITFGFPLYGSLHFKYMYHVNLIPDQLELFSTRQKGTASKSCHVTNLNEPREGWTAGWTDDKAGRENVHGSNICCGLFNDKEFVEFSWEESVLTPLIPKWIHTAEC